MISTAIPMAETLTFPTFQYRAMSPVLLVLVAAVLSVLVEGLAPRVTRRAIQLVLVGADAALVPGA